MNFLSVTFLKISPFQIRAVCAVREFPLKLVTESDQKLSLSKVSAKSEWVLTQAAFDAFLATLDRNREKAGEKYEFIRLKLLKYFQWCGSDVPDIDADETINRVTRKIYEGHDVYNLIGYVFGVAKLVHAESMKRRNLTEALDEESFIEASSIGVDVGLANYHECLEHCLGSLDDEDREVITEYYRYRKREKINCRKRLAARLGISMNTLRVKMHRQRLQLEACVEKRLVRYERTD
jgi:DNA-directed RNA polymerase specialized sigma24 family protein